MSHNCEKVSVLIDAVSETVIWYQIRLIHKHPGGWDAYTIFFLGWEADQYEKLKDGMQNPENNDGIFFLYL